MKTNHTKYYSQSITHLFFGLFTAIILSVGNSNYADAQVGVMGKRVLVKTDVINGIQRPITGLEVEYAVSRNFSISASYSFLTVPMKSKFRSENYFEWMSRSSVEGWNKYVGAEYEKINLLTSSYYSDLSKVIDNSVFKPEQSIKSANKYFGLSLNFYNGGALSSPIGKYLQMGFKYGSLNLSGNARIPILTNTGYLNSYYGEDIKYVSSQRIVFKDIKAKFLSLFMGGGKQYLITPWFMIDITGGACLNVTGFGSNRDHTLFTSMVAGSAGANLISFAPSNTGNIYDNYTRMNNTVMNLGLYFNIKAGFLIF
jgi:hypothetical protein